MARNPYFVTTTSGNWILVASFVTSGVILKKDTRPHYIHTYRISGDPAPTNDFDSLNFIGDSVVIKSDSPIDVYVKSTDVDGEVTVNL